METLAETSLPAGLRRTVPNSLIPTSPDGEQSPQNSNPGSVLANIIGTSPGGSSSAHNLLEDHSQSSQEDGSGSMVSPAPHPEPEETIENIEKELSESCVDTDSQPALDTGHGKQKTTVSPRSSAAGAQGAAPSTSSPTTSATGGKGDANGQTAKTTTATTASGPGSGSSVSNGGSLPKVTPSGGKPMAMRNLDRKINKPRRRPKPKSMVAFYQSEKPIRKLKTGLAGLYR